MLPSATHGLSLATEGPLRPLVIDEKQTILEEERSQTTFGSSSCSSSQRLRFRMSSFDDLPLVPQHDDDDDETPAVYHYDVNTRDEQPSSFFERLLDFNPCAVKISNPASAFFEMRTCAERGDRVRKFRNGGRESEEPVPVSNETDTAFVGSDSSGDDDGEDPADSAPNSPPPPSLSSSDGGAVKVCYHGECLDRENHRSWNREAFAPVLEEPPEVVGAVVRARRKAEEEATAAAIRRSSVSARDASLETRRRRRTTPRVMASLQKAERTLRSFSGKKSRRGRTKEGVLVTDDDSAAVRWAEI